jgi:hypothetical protein
MSSAAGNMEDEHRNGGRLGEPQQRGRGKSASQFSSYAAVRSRCGSQSRGPFQASVAAIARTPNSRPASRITLAEIFWKNRL